MTFRWPKRKKTKPFTVSSPKKGDKYAVRQEIEKIKLNPRRIAYLSNQLEEFQLAAIRTDPDTIRYIRKPTVKVQEAIASGHPYLYAQIKSPTDKARQIAISRSNNVTHDIPDVTDNELLEMVSKYPSGIRRIAKTRITPQIAMAAVSRSNEMLPFVPLRVMTPKLASAAPKSMFAAIKGHTVSDQQHTILAHNLSHLAFYYPRQISAKIANLYAREYVERTDAFPHVPSATSSSIPDMTFVRSQAMLNSEAIAFRTRCRDNFVNAMRPVTPMYGWFIL